MLYAMLVVLAVMVFLVAVKLHYVANDLCQMRRKVSTATNTAIAARNVGSVHQKILMEYPGLPAFLVEKCVKVEASLAALQAANDDARISAAVATLAAMQARGLMTTGEARKVDDVA